MVATASLATGWRRWQRRERQSRWFGERDRERDGPGETVRCEWETVRVRETVRTRVRVSETVRCEIRLWSVKLPICPSN
ncbi:hypothetical protein Scep_019882 [Stephania cephalantha]|uniref:Uncharacterized protein n=1 Tax=Stephania cephalantha TaxID=152367 RepID=A0AAP0IBQ9_9MAGN